MCLFVFLKQYYTEKNYRQVDSPQRPLLYVPKYIQSNQKGSLYRYTIFLLSVRWHKHMPKLDSMRWFSHRRSLSPPGGHAMVSSVAACCNGDDSAVFSFFLSLVTLTFDLRPQIRTRTRFLYTAPNRQVSSSYV